MPWSSAEKNLWDSVSDSIQEMITQPPLARQSQSVIDLGQWSDRLDEITIVWTAWHDLCSLNTHAKQALSEGSLHKGFARKPANWDQREWEAYLTVLWKYVLLTSGYKFQLAEFQKSS